MTAVTPVLDEKRTQELIEEFEAESRTRPLTGRIGRLAKGFAVATSILALYYAVAGAPIPFTRIQMLPNVSLFGLSLTTLHVFSIVFLSAALVLTFVHYPALARWRRSVHPVDLVLIVAAIAVAGYLLLNFDEAIQRVVSPNQSDFVFGLVAILLVLEATRRTVGWHLSALVLLALAYAYLGAILPTAIRHRGFDLDDIVAQQYLSLDGMLNLIYIAGSFIILFTIYGAVLDKSGAGKFFVDLAFALSGRRRSAAGRTVTLASFLLGTVSGSGVATTVTLGSITYPLLRRAGYDRDSAGAILAAGGIGAIISPPVLGAAAFIMAELLRVSYLEILVMATVPTILYYLAIFLMIEVDARKMGARAVEIAAPRAGALLREYWFHLSSLVAIVVLMALGMSPILAVFWSIVLAVAISYVNPRHALTPPKIVDALADGAKGVLSVAATIAAAGIIVGVLLQTGLGLKVSNLILALGQGNLVLTLIVCAGILWVLGLSLPITASYLVAVPTVAPALQDLGIPAAAAHMFIFYYAVLSEVSPPVGLSPFAAAALTGGNPYRTMMLTWKYALPAFLVPFMFTQPQGIAMLLRDTTVGEAAVATVTAAIGITAITTGVGGWLVRRATVPERILLVASGLLLLQPAALGDIGGFALFGAAVVLQLATRARPTSPLPRAGSATATR
ncbi:MAG: TRAP transporter fused permease subunit [Chloroflexi bacterium]|nr:TRAP transporter fused permease subunit [Chloroflexota bacterium]